MKNNSFFTLIILLLLSTNYAYSAVISDDFHNNNFNSSLWSFVDPVGDNTFSINGSRASISIPAGVSHDLWSSGNFAPRIMQSVSDSDFELKVKFESSPTSQFQMQGILVEADNSNYIRFDMYSDGADLYMFSAAFVNNSPDIKSNIAIPSAANYYLRVTRLGNNWNYSYSIDDVTWIDLANFNHTLSVSSVGMFGANAGSNPPGFHVLADYFFNTASPIQPEDDGSITDNFAPNLYNVSFTETNTEITLAFMLDELATASVSYGLTQSFELGVFNTTVTGLNHEVLFSGLTPETTYYFSISTTDLSTNTSTNYEVSTSTLVAGTAPPSVLDIWYGNNQVFGNLGTPQRWINILGSADTTAGIDTVEYSLNGANFIGVTLGSDGIRLQNTGDFNVELNILDVNDGANSVAIRAKIGATIIATELVDFQYNAANTWPKDVSIDWNTVSNIQDVAQVVDGNWFIEDSTVRTKEIGYDRLIAIGDMNTWHDYEVVVPITVNYVDPNAYQPGVGLLLRWDGHYAWDWKQPTWGWWPMGALAWYRYLIDGTNNQFYMIGNEADEISFDNTYKQLVTGETYFYKFRVETPVGEGSWYRFKVWNQNEAEPVSWDMEVQELTTDPQYGSMLLLAHHVDASFGEVSITSIESGAPQPPAPPVISEISVTTTENTATISWTTDNLATSQVDFGLDTNYGTVLTDVALKTAHSILVTGLTTETVYNFQVSSTSSNNLQTSSVNQLFQTDAAGSVTPPSVVNSDNFDGGLLDPKWTTVDPLGDSTISLTGTQLSLAVPAGSSHDVWYSNDAVRVMQPVTDIDFDLVVKFDSVPTQEFQMQGILVEQDASSFIRFDFYSDASSLNSFSATINGGTPTARNNTVIGSSLPLYIRVQRAGDVWTQSYSYDGVNWTTTTSYTYAMTVNSIGVFAGNAGSSPAFTALVDDFSIINLSVPVVDVTAPVISSIVANVTGTSTANIGWLTDELSVTQLDYGLTTSYELGSLTDALPKTSHSISLTGLTASTTYHFQVTAFDSSGNTTISPDQIFTSADLTPPVISNILVSNINVNDATISWTTDNLSTSQIDYGLDANYGSVLNDAVLKTNHSILLTGLIADTIYDFQVTSTDSNVLSASSANQSFQTIASGGDVPPASTNSDSFDGNLLDSKWMTVDPLGDSTISLTGTQLSLAVPSGNSHDVWYSNDSVRVMQGISDVDFELVVKFDSVPTQEFQLQGILIEQDASNFMRFDFYSDASNLNSFSATIIGSSPTVQNNTIINSNAPLYMRVQRVGDTWTQSYSYDGSNWTTTASYNYQITVDSVGVFAGNAGSSPAYTALVDYFNISIANLILPTAINDAYVTDEDTSLIVAINQGVILNDVDNELPNDLIASVVSAPINGSLLTFSGAGDFSYQPDANYFGVDSFVYEVTDAVSGNKAQATVIITINAVSDTPIAGSDNLTISPNGSTVLNLATTLLLNDNDVDGDQISISSFTQPANGTLIDNGDGTFTYTPDPFFEGSDSFTYVLTDGSSVSNTSTVSVLVQYVNEAPQIVSATRSFTKQVIDNTVSLTHSVAAADLDGDLDIDIVATDFGNNSVYWYERNADLTFTKRIIDSTLNGAYPVIVNDLDNDGDMDVLATGYNADTLIWYDNDGFGNFIARIVDSAADGAHSIVVADMDADGDNDILTTNQDANTVTWYENDGTNLFTRRTIDSVASGVKYAALVDIDNDGDLDVVSASYLSDEIALYENDGLQNFSKFSIDSFSDGAYYVSPADIDADGNMDLLAASRLDNTIAWYKNDGFGSFTKFIISNNAIGARTVIAEDVDGDGDIDAISSSVDNDTIAWYENDGNGNFITNVIDSFADGAYGVSSLDIDMDGDIDVLSASRDSNEIAIHAQVLTHSIAINSGVTLTIDSAVLSTLDADNAPAELVYTITNIPAFGQLLLNGSPLVIGATLTQLDIDNALFSYAHDGITTGTDLFEFSVTDGNQSLFGNFVIDIVIPGNSDTFNTVQLDSKWNLVDPIGDGTLLLNGAQLNLSVQGGVDHDAWTAGNDTLRINQAVTDGDYVTEIKFDSIPTQAYQLQGMLVEQDALNFIRFDFYSDGSSLHIFSASFAGGNPSVQSDIIIPVVSGPVYLRVIRIGDVWTQEYSTNGSLWTSVNSFSFALNWNTVGIFAGNAGGGSAPSYTAVVDYFMMN